MRFMIMLKMGEVCEPPEQLMAAMGEGIRTLMEAGTMTDTGGLRPARTRVRLTAGRVKVTDGPFTEAKELVGGFGIVQVDSHEEAVRLATELIEIHRDNWPGWEGEAEVREIGEAG